jgi:mRNA-degrading endonuclease toxin of MazEF toxin-antitoxin module
MVIIVPFTSRAKSIPYRVPVDPPEGGLDKKSYAMCDQIRTIDKIRFINKRGRISENAMSYVEDRIKILLSL